MAIRLNEADRARVRHHMGYLQVEPTSSISLGFPTLSQPLFLVERAMDNLIPSALPMVQKYLDVLDGIECQMVDALSRFKAQHVGEVKLRNSNDERTETDLLEQEYVRWATRLADSLGAPLNVYSERFKDHATFGGHIPVFSNT